MKKQELIHLHGLLAEVRDQCDEWGAEMELDDYREMGVNPTSIHHSKTDHKAAVFELATGITDSIETSEPERVAPTAD